MPGQARLLDLHGPAWRQPDRHCEVFRRPAPDHPRPQPVDRDQGPRARPEADPPAAHALTRRPSLDSGCATPPDAGIVAYFWYPPPGVIFASKLSYDAPKVLWISHDERGHLLIAAHPQGAAVPVVSLDIPPAAPPGNYPSSIAIPGAGCW